MSVTYQEMDLGPRVKRWLQITYLGNRAKSITRDFDVSEATAKRWLAGVRPTSDILSDMAKLWGWKFVSFVFEGTLPPAPAQSDMLSELAELRAAVTKTNEEIAHVAARLAHVQMASLAGAAAEPTGGVAQHQGNVARVEGGKARRQVGSAR